jgi:fused signal recognition particle receptor
MGRVGDYLYLIIGIAVAFLALVVGLVTTRTRGRRPGAEQRPSRRSDVVVAPEPTVGEDAETPRDTPTRTIEDTTLPGAPPEPTTEPAAEPALERPESAAGRLVRLRERLARSQSPLGRGLLALLSRDVIDDDTWEEIEDTLITADVGVRPTQELVARLRTRMKVEGTTSAGVEDILREELVTLVDPAMDRSLEVGRHDGVPGVVLVVGVNGTGKTTTVGKLARVLVAEDKQVVLGAADTFRAAAAEQLTTWGERVGVPAVRGPEGSDPASVAFEAVRTGVEQEVDVVIVDTAGRLQNKAGLMDELGKVRRVIEKQAPVTEVLLVLDATTGQNGMVQARVFSEVVNVTGIVLTKLDGSAKGGIVVAVQRELGVPVKLVGIGEGADDLAPFEPAAFVDALLGRTG